MVADSKTPGLVGPAQLLSVHEDQRIKMVA
jgi:hypothetical protein